MFVDRSMKRWVEIGRHALLVAGWLAGAAVSHAALFEDDEARKAILELRQRVEAQRKAIETTVSDGLAQQAMHQQRLQAEQRRSSEELASLSSTLQRSLLDLTGQIEALRGEIARLRGQNEQLARDISEVQRRQKDIADASVKVDERLRRFEPVKVSLDGREFLAEPGEKTEFEAALAVFRKGEFGPAQIAFGDFSRRHPSSGYRPAALYWQGNAQYATREYKDAIATFRLFLGLAPDHPRAPDAMLAVANCQVELKDVRAARKTLTDLTASFPQAEAAQAAKERLAKLK
jgi:tol-pal system protein YbgF